MTILYMFSPATGEYLGFRPAQIVGGKELTKSAHATTQQPPDDIPPGHAIRWTGSAWEIVEDHRQNVDSTGIKSGGTPYWLPDEGDDWQSSPRYMKELGPLPAGAVTTRPEKPAPTLEEARAAKTAEIQSGYDAALAASLTMPVDSPTAQDVSIGAALFAVDDAEGLIFVRETHAARRDELLAAVAAAESVEATAAVEVSYAV